jgi:hypothetical protein
VAELVAHPVEHALQPLAELGRERGDVARRSRRGIGRRAGDRVGRRGRGLVLRALLALVALLGRGAAGRLDLGGGRRGRGTRARISARVGCSGPAGIRSACGARRPSEAGARREAVAAAVAGAAAGVAAASAVTTTGAVGAPSTASATSAASPSGVAGPAPTAAAAFAPGAPSAGASAAVSAAAKAAGSGAAPAAVGRASPVRVAPSTAPSPPRIDMAALTASSSASPRGPTTAARGGGKWPRIAAAWRSPR